MNASRRVNGQQGRRARRDRPLPLAADQSGAVVLGRCAADMAGPVRGLIVMTSARLALGWRWERGLGTALAAYGDLLLPRFGLLWVGVFVGLKARGPEAVAAVQILVWPVGFLSTVFIDTATMPGWLEFLANWNPLSAAASTARDLCGNQAIAGGSWPAEHAALPSILWARRLVAVFAPLSARSYGTLRR